MYMVVIKVFLVVFCALALFASFYTEVFFFFYIVKVVRMISVDQKRSPAKEQPFQLIELSTWFQTDTPPTSFPHYYFVFLRNKLLYFFLYFFVFPANRIINLIPNWYTTKPHFHILARKFNFKDWHSHKIQNSNYKLGSSKFVSLLKIRRNLRSLRKTNQGQYGSAPLHIFLKL